ncbi:putative transcriptional regulator [Devosia sp. 2618]
MDMKIKPSKTVQIRRLFDTGLDAKDIVKLTGYPTSTVREALDVKKPMVR